MTVAWAVVDEVMATQTPRMYRKKAAPNTAHITFALFSPRAVGRKDEQTSTAFLDFYRQPKFACFLSPFRYVGGCKFVPVCVFECDCRLSTLSSFLSGARPSTTQSPTRRPKFAAELSVSQR